MAVDWVVAKQQYEGTLQKLMQRDEEGEEEEEKDEAEEEKDEAEEVEQEEEEMEEEEEELEEDEEEEEEELDVADKTAVPKKFKPDAQEGKTVFIK